MNRRQSDYYGHAYIVIDVDLNAIVGSVVSDADLAEFEASIGPRASQ